MTASAFTPRPTATWRTAFDVSATLIMLALGVGVLWARVGALIRCACREKPFFCTATIKPNSDSLDAVVGSSSGESRGHRLL